VPDLDVAEEVHARSFWSGVLSFGLVSIPVDLLPAQRATGGALRLLVGRGSGGLFRLESLHGKPIAAEPVRMEVVLDKAAASSPPDAVEIEEGGPLRVAVRLRGHYGRGFDYEVRLQAYAGQAFVRVQHTLIYAGGDEVKQLERLSLLAPAPAAGERKYEALLGENEKLTGDVTGAGTSFVQIDQATFRRGGETRSGRLGGWFAFGGG